MATAPRDWFPAKRFGWGWGLPRTWQGWAIFIGWFLVLVWGLVRFQHPGHPLTRVLWVLGMVLVLTGICWLTGEPPRWRWGDEER
jgi:hypothetical protein